MSSGAGRASRCRILRSSAGPITLRIGYSYVLTQTPETAASHVDSWLGVALEVPAGHISGAGEKRVNAGLRCRRIENKLGLAILLGYGVVARDGDLPERLPIRGNAKAEDAIIGGIGDCCRRQQRRESDSKRSQHEALDAVSDFGAHGEIIAAGCQHSFSLGRIAYNSCVALYARIPAELI